MAGCAAARGHDLRACAICGWAASAKQIAAESAPKPKAVAKAKPKAKPKATIAAILESAEVADVVEPTVYEITEDCMWSGPHGTVRFRKGAVIERAGYRSSWPLIVEAVGGKLKATR